MIAALGCLALALLILTTAGLPPRNGTLLLPGKTPVAAEVSALAPDIEAFDIQDRRFSLTALRGTPLIINFWATWCAPCVVEMPLLQSAHEQYPELRLVGINVAEPRVQVINWARQYGITYDLLIDGDGRLGYNYMVRALPMTIFVAGDGTIRQIVNGTLSEDQLNSEITALIAR
ncbi:MAG: TlpA disulfide reductase family protein [Anaerolineae bacterium]